MMTQFSLHRRLLMLIWQLLPVNISLFMIEVAGNYENTTQLLDGGALLNGRRPTSVYGLWRNIGYGYNGSNNQVTILNLELRLLVLQILEIMLFL